MFESNNTNYVNKVGIDLEEIYRFSQKPFNINQTFYKKIFTDNEIKYCLNFSNPYPHFTSLFAAKEAVIKCFDSDVYFSDIEIMRKNSGKPFVCIKSNIMNNISISISNTSSYAIATASMLKN